MPSGKTQIAPATFPTFHARQTNRFPSATRRGPIDQIMASQTALSW